MESTPYKQSCQARLFTSTTKVKMSDKALISDLTWRSLEMQKKTFATMPHFTIDEMHIMFRKTQRSIGDVIHIQSLGIVANNEKEFRVFLEIIKDRKAWLHSEDEDFMIHARNIKINEMVNMWKLARRDGAAKIGARISADRKKATTKECIAKIKDRWPMASRDYSTKSLLAEAGLSLNTVKSILGSRIIAQHNYRAKVKRRETLKARSNAKYPRMKRATHYIDEPKFKRIHEND